VIAVSRAVQLGRGDLDRLFAPGLRAGRSRAISIQPLGRALHIGFGEPIQRLKFLCWVQPALARPLTQRDASDEERHDEAVADDHVDEDRVVFGHWALLCHDEPRRIREVAVPRLLGGPMSAWTERVRRKLTCNICGVRGRSRLTALAGATA